MLTFDIPFGLERHFILLAPRLCGHELRSSLVLSIHRISRVAGKGFGEISCYLRG